MSLFDGLRHRLYVLWRGDAYGREVERELSFHVELDTLGRSVGGAGERDAELAARRALGNSTYVREEVRRMTPQLRLDRIRQDATYALRGLRRAPGFTLAVVLTLGLGIGVNAAMFSLLNRIFLQPPAGVAAPGDVRRFYVELGNNAREGRLVWPSIEFPQYRALRAAVDSSITLGLFTPADSTALRVGDRRIPVRMSEVSSGYFAVLGVHAAVGRLIAPDEDAPETPSPVVVLSDAFWRREFGGDRGVLGRRVIIDRHPVTIIGVTPPDFTGVDIDAVDAWLPLSMHEAQGGMFGVPWYQSFGGGLHLLARPRTPAEEARFLSVATAAIRPVQIRGLVYDPAISVLSGPIIAGLGPSTTSPQVLVATRIAGVSLLVLIIAAANVTNLLLLRATRRRREIALRRALGVSRRRLLEQLTVESLMLAAAGGLVASVFTVWAGAALRRLVLPGVHWSGGAVDTRTVAFVAAISVALGLVTGLIPAFQAMKPDLVESLKAGMRDAAYRGSKLRGALLALQAALCVVLLVGAGLFIQSVDNVRSIGIGYDTRNRIFARPLFEDPRAHRQEIRTAIPDAAQRLRGIDGVVAVAYASVSPLQGASYYSLFLPGRDSLPRLPGDYGPAITSVSPSFFLATGRQVIAGRDFTDADRPGSAEVTIVSASLARLYWPGESAIGKCIMLMKRDRCFTVVGVVADAHVRGLIEPLSTQLFVSIAQMQDTPAELAILTRPGRETAVARMAEQIVKPLVSEMVGFRVRTFESTLDGELRPWRLGATLFTALGVLALVVAAIGVYSVVAYGVSQRVNEMGVRIALGAESRDILDLVLADGLRGVAVGIAAGVGVALLLGRFVSSLLFGVLPNDPSTLIATVVILCVVAAVACLIPGWRATRVDPVAALRSE